MFKTTLRQAWVQDAYWPIRLSHGLRSPGDGSGGMVNLTRGRGVYV